MYCRSFYEYLAIKNTLRDAAEGLRLAVEPGVEGFYVGSYSQLSISLSIKKRVQDIKAIKDAIEGVTETRSMSRYLPIKTEAILKVEESYLNKLAYLLSLEVLEL